MSACSRCWRWSPNRSTRACDLEIEFRPAAVRALRMVAHVDRARLQAAIALLAQDPRPPKARRLVGRDGYRIRVGDHRILYTIDDDVLLIVVVMLGHRRDAYRT